MKQMLNFRTSEDLTAFVFAFESSSLPKKEWTHAAHLAIGAFYVLRHGSVEALNRIRVGIRRVNESHGVENSDTRGYHESLTRFWLSVIEQFLEAYQAARPNDGEDEELHAVNAVVHKFANRAGLFRRYWSYDVVASVEARRRWVEPDALALNCQIDS
jgi:hypothetical protein